MKLPLLAAALAAMLALVPAAALACACGCTVFDVGETSLMPNNNGMGLSLWLRVGEMDQDQNWEGSHSAPASDNADKKIQSTVYFLGGQYVVGRDWTVSAELPVFDRAYTTTDDGSVFGRAGSRYSARDVALGDAQLMAVYTGFSATKTTGLGFGVKLPTGDWRGPIGPLGGAEFDRDTLPGTGSTDLIVSAYHVGPLNPEGTLGYFVQGRFQFAVATHDDYRPGDEFDAAAGVTYDFGKIGPFTKVAPVLQVLNNWRDRDDGANADPLNSGYERLLLDPGVTVRLDKLRLGADVAFPLYQRVNAAANPLIEGTAGQLVAGTLLKLQAT